MQINQVKVYPVGSAGGVFPFLGPDELFFNKMTVIIINICHY